MDWWQCQWDLIDWGNALLDMCEDWKVKRWVSETGVIRRASESYLRREKLRRGLSTVFEWSPSIGDKSANVAAFRALCLEGKIFLPRGEQWAVDLVDQLCRFPGGRFDDKVDACGFIGRFVDRLRAPEKLRKGKKAPEYGSFDWLLQVTDNHRPRRSIYRG